MKLISLNIWGGTIFESLMQFVKEQAATTDIFCFQEVFRGETNLINNDLHLNIFSELASQLPDFDGYFAPLFAKHNFTQRVNWPIVGGNAIFVRRSIPVTAHDHFFICGCYDEITPVGKEFEFPVALQYIRFGHNEWPLTVVHLHGIVHPGDKLDSPARLQQSYKIISFLNQQSGQKILCGDFNLMPETESIRMIEKSGMKNLIKDFRVKSTRGRIGVQKYPDDPQHFADYMFTSLGIAVKNFTVPEVSISDHLPLILEFS